MSFPLALWLLPHSYFQLACLSDISLLSNQALTITSIHAGIFQGLQVTNIHCTINSIMYQYMYCMYCSSVCIVPSTRQRIITWNNISIKIKTGSTCRQHKMYFILRSEREVIKHIYNLHFIMFAFKIIIKLLLKNML